MTSFIPQHELRKMASEKKIKYYAKMSKYELAKALNLDETIVCKSPIAKEVIITNSQTGEEIKRCKSMYQCSKLLNKNISSIIYYLRTNREFHSAALCKDGYKIRLSHV